jgi:hypothetical protein
MELESADACRLVEVLSIWRMQEPKCCSSLVLVELSIFRGEAVDETAAARYWDTSAAQWVKPARNLSAYAASGVKPRECWRRSLCRWRTVSSRMSAFSSLLTFSPSAWRDDTIRSFSSSRHLFILARRLRSSIGFMTCTQERDTSVGCRTWKGPGMLQDTILTLLRTTDSLTFAGVSSNVRTKYPLNTSHSPMSSCLVKPPDCRQTLPVHNNHFPISQLNPVLCNVIWPFTAQ